MCLFKDTLLKGNVDIFRYTFQIMLVCTMFPLHALVRRLLYSKDIQGTKALQRTEYYIRFRQSIFSYHKVQQLGM